MKTLHARSLVGLVLLAPALLVLQFRCANPVTPEGGAKDVKPPAVTGTEPPNFSTHFQATDIRIHFNEFITLKSTGHEIFVSPPLVEKPVYKLRGKGIVVNLKDSLAPATTYIINFGKAISDITEGNVLANYRFVFSTGDFIDSLRISGRVINAFDNAPVPDVFAGLYADCIDTIPFDSLPYRIPPVYVTRTDDKGNFLFENLRNDRYKLMILDDKSGDLVYNMPAERIAFSDSLVSPWWVAEVKPDSSRADSLPASDTLSSQKLVLRLFEEVDSTQDVTRSELLQNGLFRILFKFPPRDPHILPLNIDTTGGWCIQEESPGRDTILLFARGEMPDSLILEVREGADVLDTVIISPTQFPPPKHSKNEEVKPEQLAFSWHPRGNFNHLRTKMTCTFSYPISDFSLDGIRLVTGTDTLIPSVSFTDPVRRRIAVESAWKEATMYHLIIPDSAFTGYNGISHDSVRFTFQTVTVRDLGSLILNVALRDTSERYIIQLLTDKNNVVEERFIHASGVVKFPFVQPGKYKIKAILDANRNRRWDTGDYLKKQQPEMVFLFPKTIEIRGNWDVEEEWNL